VTVVHPKARRIFLPLRYGPKVIGDFRPPHMLRFAPVALYNSFQEVDDSVAALREIVDGSKFENISLG
jgi:kynureninase